MCVYIYIYIYIHTFCGPLHMDEQRQDDQLKPTCNSSVRIQQWTIEKGDRKWSGRSILMARHIYLYTCTHKYSVNTGRVHFFFTQTSSFIESNGVACSDSISHNWVQVLSIPVGLNLQHLDDCLLRSLGNQRL